ncbi:RNA polymerase sigma factor [Dyadobacter pollutisoli]|uniref:Sigma-70 family RNA polymerase sigma factor n=1 Tax=Dyadobacter pollutisoli TaxID=2910158 RepID=A0A9E8NBT6_9BACT|nr:sigma-70 family RNA polymerase sigma factor [Dyadobacter pollutisoli]WAC11502.1 sigma-70 family RNA polymerase sigma factor [Dyadobacter pollutisoli]
MSLNRDAPHFLTVIEANKGIIYKVANAYCRDAENRKDLIQEIIIQLWLAFPKYDESYRITTWMYRIALNVSISFYRKEDRRSGIAQPLHPDIIFLQEDNTPVGPDSDIALLHRFIKELKEMDRAIILLYLEENSQQDIAEMLGITPTNVSTRILRIKEQIRQKFSALKS